MQPRRELPLLRALRVAVPLALTVVALCLALATRRLEAFSSSPFPLASPLPFSPAVAGRAPVPDLVLAGAGDRVPVEYEIRRGETLGELLQSRGLLPDEAWSATRRLAEHLDARKVRAGERYAVFFDGDLRPAAFRFDVGDRGRVVLAKGGAGWETSWTPFVRTVRVVAIAGRLDDTLDGSLQRAGGAPTLAYRLADVLQWDLDFNRDLRRGDRFEVLYEEVYLDGRLSGLGGVLALTYDNAGRRFEVFRFGDDGGYYDAQGRPLEKMFLRSPLAYSRVTSRFSHRRFHPVLKSYRPHYGVDYGAPVGTPVRVTASGVVAFAGWSKGGGRTVKVRHPNGFLTAYLHLSRFASGVGPGAAVKQGEVIAYTGNSGLSSGPHLDYRIQRNGRWIDPLALRNVPAQPIPVAQLDRFHAWRDACRRSFELGEPAPELAPTAADAGEVRIAAAGPAAGGDAEPAGR
jgi:murein DD-endopeptidase MepM/ murein hydrolase activator NlpD